MIGATAKVKASPLLISPFLSLPLCSLPVSRSSMWIKSWRTSTWDWWWVCPLYCLVLFFWPYFLLLGIIVIGSDAVIEMETGERRCSLKSLRAFSADCSGLDDLQTVQLQSFLRHSVALNLCVFFPEHKLYLSYLSIYGRGFYVPVITYILLFLNQFINN